LAHVVAELGRFLPPARLDVEPRGVHLAQREPARWTVLVRPRSEEDIRAVVLVASKAGVALIIGGGTAHGRPAPREGGSVQLDMTGLERTIDLDVRSQILRVQAGVSVAALRNRLHERRLFTGWTLSSEDPHTLGGVLSGVAVRWGARYGSPFDNLRGVVAVLPDGTIYREPVAPRRAMGPDLASLLLGTRGKMGILVEVAMRVMPWPAVSTVVELDLPTSRLIDLRGLFDAGLVPHLLECTADSNGAARVSASLHGRAAEVNAAVALLADLAGQPPRELLGMPVPAISSGEAAVVQWGALDTFVRAWAQDSRRTSFVLDCVTAHSLRVTGGGRRAHLACAQASTEGTWPAAQAGLDHLEGVKQRLDPLAILGRL
jgi:FAD/FMN-containing dehydrogenase